MQSHIQLSIRSLKSEIGDLRDEVSKFTIQEMSVSPLTDEKLAFWRQRGALAEKYYQLGAALEREGAYEDAARAYWDSYQINPNDSASKKLWIGNSKAIASGALLKIETDLPAAKYFYLGLQYLSGLGYSQNAAQAAACFVIAAEQGYADAQRALGWMYANGRGVQQDDAQAVRWFRLAAAQGVAGAQRNLGVMYETGRGPTEVGSAKEYRREYKNGIRDALKMLRICKDKLRDFESRYHYAVASYSPLKDKIIGAYLSDLIKKEPNEILEAVINDDLLSASERKAFLQKIFEAHRRDKKHSGFLGFFQPASTSQLSDENYGKLCYGMGSQLYETAELRKYPDRIAQAKIYYNQVPQTSTFYRKAMSELFDLEIGLDWVEKLRDETQSTEAREDKLWGLHNAFFKGKGIESGHEALDTYNEFEAAIRTMKD